MQKKPKCIFMFGSGKFDAQYPSTSFTLAKEFAKNGNNVFYIDYPFTFKDKFRLKNTQQYKNRKDAFAGKNDGLIETEMPNLRVLIIPPLLSIHFLPEGLLYRFLLKINEKLIAKKINQVIKKFSIKDYVYINSFLFHYPNVAKYLNPILKIYHCVDPVITPYDIKHGIKSEKELIKLSDVIICTSNKLYIDKKALHTNTHFISNAADITHSIKAMQNDLPVHDKLLQIKRPVVGYFGNIERRIDYNLLYDVTSKNPDKSFVFAGPVQKDLVPEFFFKIPNVYLTGRIPYEEMPNMLKGFDIAIIPFKKNEESATVFPLKLFEYLGAGKPVISTDFNPDLKNFTNSEVAYCEDSTAFSEAINNALQTNTTVKEKARIKLASQHTWERRAMEFEKLIDINIATKKINFEI